MMCRHHYRIASPDKTAEPELPGQCILCGQERTWPRILPFVNIHNEQLEPGNMLLMPWRTQLAQYGFHLEEE